MSSTGFIDSLPKGATVAVIDDEPEIGKLIRAGVLDADYNCVLIEPTLTIEDLVEKVLSEASAAVCDFRLGQKEQVQYWGSEVVARINSANVPAVLYTSWANTDENREIRKWRAKIPRLISRDDGSDPELVAGALGVANEELRGHFTPERKPYQTVVRIVEIENVKDKLVANAEVVVTAWKPETPVSVPLSIFTDAVGELAGDVRQQRFIADVNIYAENEGDLYFRNIYRARDLDESWLRR